MSVKTVILGFLRYGPQHGYELKRRIEQQMGDWADIRFGSIYFALEKLTKDGFVTAETQESQSNRPSRIVYTITDKGREEYLSLLRELWQDHARTRSPLDVAIAFIRDLPEDEVRGYLRDRLDYLEQVLSYVTQHEEETMANPHVPRESRFIFSHARYQLLAERDWTRDILANL